MSDLDSEIREPFYGFEPQYRLRSRTQQSDPPVRPRIFRPSPRCLPNDARKFKPEFVIIPSKASTKAQMAGNEEFIVAMGRQQLMVQPTKTKSRTWQTSLITNSSKTIRPFKLSWQRYRALRWSVRLQSPSALYHAFFGGVHEDPQSQVDHVHRVAGLERRTEEDCLLVAMTRLNNTASQWHVQSGYATATWPLWSAVLVNNFMRTLSFWSGFCQWKQEGR